MEKNGKHPHPSICMRRKKVETKQGKRSICTNHIEDAKSGVAHPGKRKKGQERFTLKNL